MAQDSDNSPNDDEGGVSLISVAITLLSLVALGLFWWLSESQGGITWKICFLFSQVVVISIVIWQACDPFADAAQWIGHTFRLPGSVRGATLDAVASSMPELFCGIFFVVVSLVGIGDSPAELAEAGRAGFGATIATVGGSAVYNMILIPAFCAIFISYYRKERPTIDVEPEVISRDGIWFLGCSTVMLVFLIQDKMHWWMAVVLLFMYAVYVVILFRDAKLYQRAQDAIHSHLKKVSSETTTAQIVETLRAEKIRATPMLVDQIRHGLDDDSEEEENDTAGALFGLLNIPLNHLTAWLVILVSTLVAAVACYWLVEVTFTTATSLNINVFFVAVILAAAASSVPDTFLSVMAAKRGDDSGAVSNAFGSNIFNICICLPIPMLIFSYLSDWQPIQLTIEGAAIAGLYGLRILLLVLTIITLLIMWHNRQLTRNKAWVLCGLYVVFITYAIIGAWDDNKKKSEGNSMRPPIQQSSRQ